MIFQSTTGKKGLIIWTIRFFCLLQIPELIAQENNYRFHTYDVEDGLPNLNVNAIHQDKYGFMWFGTDKGFCRYDGYEFKTFDQLSKPNESIRDLFLDINGLLWMGTNEGILTFNTILEKEEKKQTMQGLTVNALAPSGDTAIWMGTSNGLYFYSIEKDTATQIRLIKNASNPAQVFDLMISEAGQLWISTTNEGLISYDLSDKYIKIYQQHRGKNSLSSNVLRHLAELPGNRIAIGTESKGLNILDPNNEEIINYSYNNSDRRSISSNSVFAVWPLDGERLLAGAYAGGLNILNLKTNKSLRFLHDPKDPSSIPTNSFRIISESKDGNIWIGTEGKGVIRLNPKEQQIVRYVNNRNNSNSLSSDFVRSVYEDEDGSVWIGTQQTGLNNYDPITEKYTQYLIPEGSRESLARSTIWSLSPGSNGTLWMGTSRGIGKLNRKTKQIKFYEPKDYKGLLGNNVLKVLDDGNGRLWAGSWYGGLNVMDIFSERVVKSYTHDPTNRSSINSNNVNEVYIDKKERVWVGSDAGLCLLLKDQENFRQYETGPVLMIAEDANGILWLSTSNGLVQLNPETEEIQRFSEKRKELGKTGNIVIDRQGMIWLSSDLEIYRFDPKSDQLIILNKADGIVGNHNNSRAAFLGKEGHVYLGGVDGLISLDPQKIDNTDAASSEIQLTQFLLFNKPVDITESTILDKSIHAQPALTLNYKDYLFAIEFAAMEFTEPEAIQYEYKLENFDDHWISTNSKFRKATFTNVPSGSYEFKVRVAEDEASEVSVPIFIIPPWWETWWAKTLYIVSPILLFVAIFQVRVRILKNQRNKLEVLVAERTTEISRQNKKLIELREREKVLSEAAITTKERELASMSMAAHEKNNLLKDLEQKVSFLETRMGQEMKQDFKALKRTISNGYSLDNSWDSFLHNFQEVHPQFFDRLKQDNPRLTNDDLKISAYLKIGMTNKDIANVTNLTLGSVKSKINRLKKKLELNAEDSVRDFMLKYAS